MSLKQGLMQLRQHARSRGLKFQLDEKAIIIPIYSFINQLVSSMKSFLNSQQCHYWYVYLVNEHLRDRSFPNIIKSWQRLSITSLECHLLQSLLIVNNKNKLKIYLKARKFIVQTASNSSMLDEILLNVQDAISVIHKLYQNQYIRKALGQGIKNIFMAFRMSEAKIYSSVFIEYLLTVYDSVFKVETEEATISGSFSNYKSYENSQNYIELYSSISNFQSGMHQENGLYKKISFTQHTPKKYQIIDRKFIPLKEASQSGSTHNTNNILSPAKKKFKKSIEKEKSSFYDFINHSYHHRQQQDNHQVSQEQSSIQNINSFSSKSYEKQQQQYLREKQAIQQRYQNAMQDKENSIIPSSYKVSMERQTATDHKHSLNRHENNKSSFGDLNKNFSLSWFSKKLFQTSGDEERESVLRRQKERMKKKGEQRKKLHIISADSTQKYEIENHIFNKNSLNKGKQSIEKQNHRNISSNIQSQVESVKQMQFEKMVSKNQEFKQKMLKKNYPSISQSEYVNGSQHHLMLQKGFSSYQTNNKSQEDMYQNAGEVKRNGGNDVFYQDIKGNSRTGNNKSMLKKDVLYMHGVPPQRIKTVKQRNESSSLNSLNSRVQNQPFRKSQKNTNSVEKHSNFGRNNNKRGENWQEILEKPQIIHKSIGKSRINNFSQNTYQNKPLDVQLEQQRIFQQQDENEYSRNLQKSSFSMDKMKKMISIIDKYHQNHQQSSSRQQLQQQGNRELRISQSICKKSKFDTNNMNDSGQDEIEIEIENYSFY